MELTGNVSGMINLGGGGGSTVEVTPILTSGEHIADIDVDGVTSELYAPEPTEPTEVEVTPIVTSGAHIADIEVDGVTSELYAPTADVKLFIDTSNILATFNTSTLSSLSDYEIPEDCYATFKITPRTSTGFYLNIDGVYVIETWYEAYSTRWYGIYLKKGQKITVTATPYDTNNSRFGCVLYGLY